MTPDKTTRGNQSQRQLRAAGLRLVQIWIPNTSLPGFAEECRRQSLLAAEADIAGTELQTVQDEILSDTDGWTA
jgi:hypothetical protein